MKLELIEEYRLSAAQHEAIRLLMAEAFPDSAFTESRTYLKQIPARRLLATDNGRLVGHLGLEHRVIGTATGPATIFGIVDVCVANASHGRGVASEMLASVEALAREHSVEFLLLFASNHRVYEKNGYCRAHNALRWMMIDEHQMLGLTEQVLDELMIKPLQDRPWPDGLVDLLGHQF